MILRMKSYIKPFERVLAIMELKSLTGITDISEQEDYEYVIDSDVSEEMLRDNLAYWESVGDKITRQVMLENTYNFVESYERSDVSGSSDVNIRNIRILRYGVHDIHEYRGKFFPQLVRACINISGIAPGSVVLDTFCGSGTTLCEARIRGMRSLGIDLNPLSVMITRVKTEILKINKEDILKNYILLKKDIDKKNIDYKLRWNEADIKYLEGWFSKEALQDINIILCAIETVKNDIIADFFRINLSNVIREISWQKESDLRVRKEIGEYHRGTAISRFEEEAERQFARIHTYLNIVNKLELPATEIIEGNTVELVDRASEYVGSCDVIITSPPYATALPYLDTDRLSILILGLMHRKEFSNKNYDMVGNREISESKRRELWNQYQIRRNELTGEICEIIDKIAIENHKPGVGFRRRNLPALLAKYFLDMLDSMKAAYKMLKTGSKAFYVVGNNSTTVAGEKIIIETNVYLWNLGEKVGLVKESYIDMDMLKAKVGYQNNPGTTEAILVFRKEDRNEA
jgi:site-specific DNA-methyltransferase (cytosine-N4-specific)